MTICQSTYFILYNKPFPWGRNGVYDIINFQTLVVALAHEKWNGRYGEEFGKVSKYSHDLAHQLSSLEKKRQNES